MTAASGGEGTAGEGTPGRAGVGEAGGLGSGRGEALLLQERLRPTPHPPRASGGVLAGRRHGRSWGGRGEPGRSWGMCVCMRCWGWREVGPLAPEGRPALASPIPPRRASRWAALQFQQPQREPGAAGRADRHLGRGICDPSYPQAQSAALSGPGSARLRPESVRAGGDSGPGLPTGLQVQGEACCWGGGAG